MRQRNRGDWPIKVYRYWADPVGELPQFAWDHAHQMAHLWNAMVAARVAAREGIRVATDGLEGEARRIVARPCWDALRQRLNVMTQDNDLDWSSRAQVRDSFDLACRQAPARRARAIAAGAAPHPNLGEPRPQYRLDTIHLPYRSATGGWPLTQIFGERTERDRTPRAPWREIPRQLRGIVLPVREP